MGLSRMGKFTFIATLVFVVGSLSSVFFPGSILSVLQDAGFVGLIISASYYAYRALKWLQAKLLWKVRSKIIVSYGMIGIVPVAILLLVTSLVFLLIFKSLSGFYLELELDRTMTTLEEAGERILFSYYRQSRSGEASLSDIATRSLREMPLGLRNGNVFVYVSTAGSEDGLHELSEVIVLPGHDTFETSRVAPGWMRDRFSDLVLYEEELRFVSVYDLTERVRLILQLPFDQDLIDDFKRRTSISLLLTQANPTGNEFQQAYANLAQRQDFFSISWAHFFRPVQWTDGEEVSGPWSLLLSVPLSILLERFLAGDTGTILGAIVALLLVFAIVEVGSLVVGAAIARSITHSIHNIYLGAQNIQRGNFGFRIPSKNRDQLDTMADAFNDMSSSIVELMDQVSEREWLEKELEIAKEVQNQLFPQQIPEVERLEISATCRPARQVSGDYYDFLTQSRSSVDIVVGDISGKGISAALLMASSQATIRSGLFSADNRGSADERIAQVVREVNKQLYHRSSPELYSTLVLGNFDSETLKFSYCNAGHHPPLVFSGDEVRSLMVGGTVVGLFENWAFEGATTQLSEGDLLVLFTDGVVEAENKEGEQFGTDRVIEMVQANTFLTADDIETLLIDQVFDWSAGLEQADDITVVCLKVRGA